MIRLQIKKSAFQFIFFAFKFVLKIINTNGNRNNKLILSGKSSAIFVSKMFFYL